MKNLPSHPVAKEQASGFALVATVSMMVLLTMIALGMLSLTTLEQRSSGSSSAKADQQARANARMALMMALGELQKQAGADTRITAPGNIISGGNGSHKITGVWRSWEGLDHDITTGFPGYDSSSGGYGLPDYSIKTADYNPDNPENGRFLGWLVSEQGNWSATSAPQLNERPEEGSVPLLASGTLKNNTEFIDSDGETISNEVHVIPTNGIPTENNSNGGTYAWWVSGENQKANLSEPIPTPNSTEKWDQRLASAGQPDASFFGLSLPSELSKVVSRDSLDLMTKEADAPDKLGGENFYHLTVHSKGLLTNTATGGWRRDLSLMSEQWSDLPSSDLPFFTKSPGVETGAEKATSSSTANHLIYPWAVVQNGENGENGDVYGDLNAVCSWNALMDYATQYKIIQSSSPITMPSQLGGSPSTEVPLYEIRDKTTRFPVIARIQWVYCYSSKAVDPNLTGDDDDFVLCMVVNPIVTLWNPYNIKLTVNDLTIQSGQVGPMRFRFWFDNVAAISNYFTLTQLNSEKSTTGKGNTILKCRLSENNLALTFLPGETKVFSPAGSDFIEANPEDERKYTATLLPGYRSRSGFRFELWNPDVADTKIIGKGSQEILARLRHTASSNAEYGGAGLQLRVIARDSSNAPLNGHDHNATSINHQLPAGLARDYWPNDTAINNFETLKSVHNTSSAFYSSLTGPKAANRPTVPVKGTLQCNPINDYTTYLWDHNGPNANGFVAYKGRSDPHTWNYDHRFLNLNGWNDPNAPSGITSEPTGYIGPSHEASDGLVRLIMAHVPARPLQSLAELQHFNIRQYNGCAPYSYNIIGNSHAQPSIAAARTHIGELDFIPPGSDTPAASDIHQNDDSYIANHLLFDDWFVSSITPDTTAYSATEDRSLMQVYIDHLSGTTPLPNHRYLPANPAVDTASQAAEDLTASANWQPWYHIASKLQVHGMFNINSTSVEAWGALLRHLKNAEVAYYKEDGTLQTDTGMDHPVSRSSVSPEAVAGGSTNSSGGFPEATEFTGYRRFTDAQIDALAEQIVTEIMARGPFLSLSEFINRRLTNDPTEQDLARAGVLEAALLNLSERSGNENPYAELQLYSNEITSTTIDNSDHYQFPYAALGYDTFGYPGWVRQADLLRPLAPILTARDDTFTIRAYGDARDENGEIITRAWCEAIVTRSPDYVDSTDANTDLPGPSGSGIPESKSVNAINETFGRRFKIITFRWLDPSEV